MEHFWEGFSKKGSASFAASAAGLVPLLALGGAVAAGAAGARTDRGKESAKTYAESLKALVEDASKTRSTTPGQYFLNPAVPGPISEAALRLARRESASRAEHPVRTTLIPGYGMIRGGKAGTPKD